MQSARMRFASSGVRDFRFLAQILTQQMDQFFGVRPYIHPPILILSPFGKIAKQTIENLAYGIILEV